jgi:exodeoxyribonuclease-3
MRITTWNVNGLRAALNKGFVESVRALDSDVLCLQEIKSRPEQIDKEILAELLTLYPHQLWNPAQRPGYSGTATLARNLPDAQTTGMGSAVFDGEGRVIISNYNDLRIYNIYFPNGRNDLSRVPYKLDFYAHLLEQCDSLHQEGKKIVLCGDFNTAHKEIDLKNPKANSTQTGFLPEERAWIDRYLEHDFVDAFRKLYPEKIEYTWWTFLTKARERNVGWRLDYFLVSQGLMPGVRDVVNHTAVLGSDHCPVSLDLA